MIDGYGRQELQIFAASAVHALRTPLAALSGEVELALRRNRPADAYRDALSRIALHVAELINLTEDFAILGQSGDAAGVAFGVSNLAAVLETVAASDPSVAPAIDGRAGRDQTIIGEPRFVARALKLVLEHVARHRSPSTQVSLRVANVAPETVDLVLLITPALPSGSWQSLDAIERGRTEHAGGAMRLGTAARIVAHCGGAIEVGASGASDVVRIRLRRATAAAESA